MNHAKNYVGIALAGILLSGCAYFGDPPATEDTYNTALAAAKVSLNAAMKARFIWRDSWKILKKSAKAAKKGDYETATKLAKKAQRQGDLALAQSKEQANAGSQ